MSRSRGSEEAKGRDDVAGASCTGWSTRLGQESLCGAEHGSHGSKSQYRSLTRRVPRRIGLGVSVWYRTIRKIS